MELKFKNIEELKELLKTRGWEETDESFELKDDCFDEFISINKTTGYIIHSGYNCLLADYFDAGLVEIV